MSMWRQWVFAIAGIGFALPSYAAERADAEPETISIIDLIANGAKYDGHLVQVGGFISLRFEDDAIYLSKQDYTYLITENAIWVDIGEATQAKLKDFDQRYGYVVGTFSSKQCGHVCQYHGSIKFSRLGLTYKDSNADK